MRNGKVVFLGSTIVISTGRTRQDSDKWFSARETSEKKYSLENFFGYLGWSRDRNSVIEIAQNDRKKKILPLQIRLKFRCKKTFVAI